MEVSQDEEENTKTIFQQWSQEEIIFRGPRSAHGECENQEDLTKC